MKIKVILSLALSASLLQSAVFFDLDFETVEGYTSGNLLNNETDSRIDWSFNGQRGQITSTDLTYTDPVSGNTVGGGQSLGVAQTGNFGVRDINSSDNSVLPWWSTNFNNSDIYVSFVVSAPDSNNTLAAVGLNFSNSASSAGLTVDLAGDDFYGGAADGTEEVFGGESAADTPYFFVFKVNNVGDESWRTTDVWVNPAFGTMESAPNLSVAGSSPGNVTNDGLVFEANDSSILFDAVTIGETWGDVVPVPEPSTYAALAGALVLGLAVVRRRK